MNMKHLKRISVMSVSALGMVGILLTLLETFGVRVFSLFDKAASASVVLLLLLIIVLFALAGLCAYTFYLANFEEKIYKARMVTLQGTKDDVVLIRHETLDQYVESIVGNPEGVKERTISTQYANGALDVTVTMSVHVNANIASLVSDIQANIREQLETVNGIKLSRVAVIISGIIVPENTEGMKMPWADQKEEAPAENIVIEENTEEAPAEEAEEVADKTQE